MNWDPAAKEAVSRAPFFVRKRIRKKVEEEARRAGARVVGLEHVRTSQRRFMRRMEEEVKGWQVETCFGPGGCPNRVVEDDGLVEKIEEMLGAAGLKAFLKELVGGPLKMHHELRVVVSDCPNACSRPQIADVGLIGARRPALGRPDECTACGACVEACREEAVVLADSDERLVIADDRCQSCGQCISVCPTGAMIEDGRGYRIQVGGKLGRHPQLARELSGIFSTEEALAVVKKCIDHYKAHNRKGERFGEVLNRTGLEVFTGGEETGPSE